jgi:hypothetical protein
MTFMNIRSGEIDFFHNVTIDMKIHRAIEKVLFNHKVHKVGSKCTKVNPIFQIFVIFVLILCDLSG